MVQNKSSNPTVNSIDLKAKAVKWHRYISTVKNIYASENIKSRKVIIDDIIDSLDKDILRQVKEAINNFSSSLFIGNKDKGFLAACYAHCIRDIDYRFALNNYKYIIVNGKYLDSAVFKYDNCFGKSLSPEDVKKWMDWFSYGYTVFLHRLKIGDSYQCKSFFRSLVNSITKISTTTKATIQSGLFIISIDSKSDLPDYFREEFTPIMLDGEEKATLLSLEVFGTIKDPELIKHPKLIKFIQAYPEHKYLLLKNGHIEEGVADTIANILLERKHFDEIIHVDCIRKNNEYLLKEVLSHPSLETKALVLDNISGGNNSFLSKMTKRILIGKLPLVVVALKEGEQETDLGEGIPGLFQVVDMSEQAKKEILPKSEEAVVEPAKETIEQEKKAEREKAKEKLSKSLAYIRLDDNDDMFYVKAKNDTEEVPLNLSPKSQEYKLLLYLYNIYGSRNSKASSEDLLIVCDIQNHEKGESVDEKKINHLRKIVSDVRTALEKAGLKRGHLKYEYKVDDKNRVEKDECCLLIHCSPK